MQIKPCIEQTKRQKCASKIVIFCAFCSLYLDAKNYASELLIHVSKVGLKY